MILYFMDRKMNGIGLASIMLPDGLTIDDDLRTEEVDTGVTTFECTIPFSKDTRSLVESATKSGNYVLCNIDNESEVYTIIDSEINTKKGTAYIYAEDAGLDLLNEIVMPYEATEAHPIAWYINRFAYDTGFEIGINEAADLARMLSWDGESTITERLTSVATQFDCELSYSFTVDGLQLTHKYINIYRERGNNSGVPLRLNYEIDNIVTSSSIANLATALYPTGGTPEGAETAITLYGFEYDDGDIYLENGYLKSREAVKKWSRYLNPTEPDQNYTGHILRTYTYDTTDQSTLCAHAVAELRKACEMEVNYKVDITSLPANVRIGDRVNVVDDAGGLYVSSRILKLETSIVNHKRTATLGEYLIKDSGINQKVVDLAVAFAAKAQETARAFAVAQAAQDAADSAGTAADAAQTVANNAVTAASNAQSTANSAASVASTAQETADNIQTDLDNNYTDTTGMAEAINLKFGQITLTVEAGTGDDEGKLFVKVNGGGTNKQGTIDLTGRVKFSDLETEGNTTINGANITAGTLKLNGLQSESGDDVLMMDSGGFKVESTYQPSADDPVQTTTYKLVDGQIQAIGGGGTVIASVGVNPYLGTVEIGGAEINISGPTLINGKEPQSTLAPSYAITSSISVANQTSVTLCSKSLAAGTYLIFGMAQYATNQFNSRGLSISTSTSFDDNNATKVAASPTWNTSIPIFRYITITSTTTVRLIAFHDAGSTLTVSPAQLLALKLS